MNNKLLYFKNHAKNTRKNNVELSWMINILSSTTVPNCFCLRYPRLSGKYQLTSVALGASSGWVPLSPQHSTSLIKKTLKQSQGRLP